MNKFPKKLSKEQLVMTALAGVLLLVIAIPLPKESEKKETEEISEVKEAVKTEKSTQQQLKEILQKISGVGKVEVLITYEDEGRMVVEKDDTSSEELIRETDSNGGTRTTTVTQNEKETVYGNGDTPYIVQELSPTVRGVLVVAQGAGNEAVKKQILETIQALFGLEEHKISIMKMEVSK